MTTSAMASRNEHNATLTSNRCERLLASGPRREAVTLAVVPPCHIRRLDWPRQRLPMAPDLRSSGMMKQRELNNPEQYQSGGCHQIEAQNPHP